MGWARCRAGLLMINMLSAVNSSVQSSFNVSISPENFSTSTNNGSYTTPFFEALAQGGVGPYEYEWSITDTAGLSTLTETTDEKTRIKTGGYNTEVDGVINVLVKDTGNGNAELSASANYVIFFGERL